MCSVLLRHGPRHNRWYNLVEGWLEGLARGYRRALGLALRHRAVVVVAGLLVAGASGVLFSVVKSELAPVEDRGLILEIERAHVRTPVTNAPHVRRLLPDKKQVRHHRQTGPTRHSTA